MITVTLDAPTLTRLANTVAAMPYLADEATEAALTGLLRDTLALMRSRADMQANPTALVHVVSGRLRDSFSIAGPHKVGRGTLEGSIRPGVPYAADEIARGGHHDYVAQTLAASVGLRDAAAARAAAAIVAILEAQ